MPVAPGKRNVQNKPDLIQYVAQEKIASSTHSMNDVIAFYVFNTRFESSVLTTQKGNINKLSAEQESRSMAAWLKNINPVRKPSFS